MEDFPTRNIAELLSDADIEIREFYFIWILENFIFM